MVDPILDHFDEDMKMVKDRGFSVTHVIDTHTHADHISAGAAWKDAVKCHYVMHESAKCGCMSVPIRDGDMIQSGSIKIQAFHTPGHTGDSLCLLSEGYLFTGDLLFLDDAGGGRDDLPGGDSKKHWESLQKVMTFPDTLMIYPAHEYRDRKPSTLGHQRQTNPHLKQQSQIDFIHYIDDLRLGPADWMKDVINSNQSCATNPRAAWIPTDMPACEVKGTIDDNVNAIPVFPIDPITLKRMLDLRKNIVNNCSDKSSPVKNDSKWVMIDVREPEELSGSDGHIDGVKNYPIGQLTHKLNELDACKNGTAIVVCRSGSRAATGARILMSSGFKNVKVLEGGMVAWNQAFA